MNPNALKPGDVLLYHGQSWVGWFIARATSSPYCHAAMIGPDGTVLEMYDTKGGKTSPIEEHSKYKIDVFRCPDAERAFWASIRMRDAIQAKYSLSHAIGAGLARCFWFLLRPTQKECNRHGLHCSQAVSLAYRAAGLDPWPCAPDWRTTPGHLADSTIFENLGPLEF